MMEQNEIVEKMGTVAVVLRGVAWLVALVGFVWAVGWVLFGFTATEPWWFWGAKIDENWESVMFGFLGAGLVLIYTAVVWSVLQLGGGVAAYIGVKAARMQ